MASQGMILRNLALVGQTARATMQLQNKPTFEEGCRLAFGRWTALQLGVENEWGGSNSKEKGQQLLADVIDWFYTCKDLDQSELEDLLDEALQVDFNIQAEDDSPYLVARSLINMHNQVAGGDFSYVERLRRMQPVGVDASQNAAPQGAGGDEDDSSSSDDDDASSQGTGAEAMDAEGGEDMDMDEAPAAEQPRGPVVDEDGFQVVQRKGRGGRR